MSASPFKTYEEFSTATENIASFSHVPAFNYIMCAIGLGLTIWFVVTSFTIKH